MSPTEPEIVQALEAAEIAACRSYTTAAPPAVAGALGLALRPLGPALAVRAAALDILMFNRVTGLGVAAPAGRSKVEEAVAFFREAAVRRCMVQLAPGAGPDELAEWLGGRGFALHNHWLRLYRDTSRPGGSEDPRVRRIGPTHAEAFGRTCIEAFGYPAGAIPWIAATVGREGWHHFGSFTEGEPVGFGALFVHGPTAWFGFAATRASHRGRGIQTGLIAARLRAAAELGCRLASVETADDTPEKPNPSTHNLARLGFQVAYRRPNWVLPLELEDKGAGSA